MSSIFLQDAYTSLGMKSDMDCIFTDFSKAYDTIWHQGLYHKLRKNKINGNFLCSIINFLSGRQTGVVITGGQSDWYNQLIRKTQEKTKKK